MKSACFFCPASKKHELAWLQEHHPDLLAGVESRGFLMAAPLALKLGCGFIMLRKKGKLPGETVSLEYALEYGSDRIEVDGDGGGEVGSRQGQKLY